MATIVTVPAAFAGGWLYKEVRVGLQAAGHEVYALTPTGLGERIHLATPEVDLDTHTQDVVNVLEYEDLRDVVLVGHSFGGMVLSAVADRAAARLARLIYLDAVLPRDGECMFDAVLPRDGECMFDALSPEARGSWEERAQQLGEGWRVPPWNPSDRRMVPMPLKPTQQPLRLTATGSRTVPGTFIHCTAKSGVDAFVPVADRARGWPVYELATGHNPLSKEADRTALLDLLLQIVQGRRRRQERREAEPASAAPRVRPTQLPDRRAVGAPAVSVLPGVCGHAVGRTRRRLVPQCPTGSGSRKAAVATLPSCARPCPHPSPGGVTASAGATDLKCAGGLPLEMGGRGHAPRHGVCTFDNLRPAQGSGGLRRRELLRAGRTTE